MIKIISIKGFRGFGEKQNINFSIPNGKDGSGLSILVGANNCGKTSILEAIKSFNGNESPSFSVGKRNLKSGDYIELVLEKDDGKTVTIRTIGEGGSSTIKDESERNNFYILQSRRFVEYQFGKGSQSRDDYLLNYNTIGNGRTSQLNQFNLRLFEMQKHKEDFNRVLKRILGDDLY